MRRLALFTCLLSTVAVAAGESPPPRKWRCRLVHRVWLCDRIDRQLVRTGQRDAVTLFERKPFEPAPLVTPPASLLGR